MADESVWRSPEELVTIGFQCSTVVMMNEAHNDLKRCIRTREIGRRILPAANQAGVRHLAMEALWPYSFAAEANRTRQVPAMPEEGYLAQPEMRIFMQAALDLGWTLVPYEADYEAHPAELEKWESSNLNQEQQAHSRSKARMESQNWRKNQQARTIANTLDKLPAGTDIYIYDVSGNRIAAFPRTEHGRDRRVWSLSGSVSSGVYIYVLSSEKDRRVGKFSVIR